MIENEINSNVSTVTGNRTVIFFLFKFRIIAESKIFHSVLCVMFYVSMLITFIFSQNRLKYYYKLVFLKIVKPQNITRNAEHSEKLLIKKTNILVNSKQFSIFKKLLLYL